MDIKGGACGMNKKVCANIDYNYSRYPMFSLFWVNCSSDDNDTSKHPYAIWDYF